MADREERLLQQNVEELTARAEAAEDMNLYRAMRQGMMEGKQRERKRKVSYGIAVAAAAIIAAPVALSYADYIQSGTAGTVVQRSGVQVWTDSGAFISGHYSDRAVVQALENNIIKPIYVSAEKKGIRVEVMGAVTDGRKAFILYSVQNNSSQAVQHVKFTLDYGKLQAPSIGTSLELGSAGYSVIEPGQTVNFAYTTTLVPTETYPKDVNYNVTFTENSEKALLSSSNKYRTSLSIPFELDPDMFKADTKKIAVNRTLSVDGQNIRVHQILYTPLATYVDLAYDEQNSKQIFQLLNPVLTGKNGERNMKMYYPDVLTSTNSEVYTERNSSTLVFSPHPLKAFDEVSLKVAGIAALDRKQMSISVDLNKKKIIAAPDQAWTLAEPEGKEGTGEIRLGITFKRDPSLTSFFTRLADSFTDAKGATHPFAGGEGASSRGTTEKSVEETHMLNFGKEAKDYPQPLTIAIDRYWAPVLDSQTLELHSK